MVTSRPALMTSALVGLMLLVILGTLYVSEARQVLREQNQRKEAAITEAKDAAWRHEEKVKRFWKHKTVLQNALQAATKLDAHGPDKSWKDVTDGFLFFTDDTRLQQLGKEAMEAMRPSSSLREKIRVYNGRLTTEPQLREVLQEKLTGFEQEIDTAMGSSRPRYLSLAARVAELDPPGFEGPAAKSSATASSTP